ncbi:MAG: phosphonatase-like hydrolase [Bacteroidota bacterium]
MIQLVVFDMAGTTVNENNVVYKTLHRAIQGVGYPVSLEEVLLWGAGKEKRQAIIDTVQEIHGQNLSAQEAEAIHTHFRQELTLAYQTLDVQPCEGAEAVFATLQSAGIKVGLNTGYGRETADQLLRKLGWQVGREIDACVTADQVERGRPHPDMIWLVMEQTGISDPQQVAKIGDSIIDIEEGKAAKCGLSLGVTTGAHTRDQLASAQPDHVLDQLSELLTLLSIEPRTSSA